MAKSTTSDMAHVHIQWGVDHNPCCTPTKIGMVAGGSRSMEMAALCLWHGELHAAVFHIIDVITQGKDNHIWHGLLHATHPLK